MNKNIRKFFWGDLSHIEECEEYFSDMSREGLHLEKIGRFFLYFQEGDPKNLNYRIDLAKKDEKEMKIKLRKDEGWHFIDDSDVYLIFSSEKSSNLNELYLNSEAQRLAIIDSQGNKIKNPYVNMIFETLAIVLLIGIVFLKIKTNNGIYLSMSKEHEIYGYIFFTIIPLINRIRTRRNLKKVEKILETGEFLRHEGDYYLMNRRFIIKRVTSVLIIFFAIIIILNKVSKNENMNLNLVDDLNNLPMITIADIEKADNKYDESRMFEGNNDYSNMIRKNWNVLIPKNYSLIERLEIYNGISIYSKPTALLIVDYYLGRFDFIAEGLEKDILKRENINYGTGLKKIKIENNISSYGVKKNDTIYLLLRKDRHVIFLKYYDGKASIEEIMEKSLKKLGDYK